MMIYLIDSIRLVPHADVVVKFQKYKEEVIEISIAILTITRSMTSYVMEIPGLQSACTENKNRAQKKQVNKYKLLTNVVR